MNSDGIEFLDLVIDDPRVVAIAATGRLTAKGISQLAARLERLRESGRKARLYVDLSGYAGYDLPVVREKLSHMSTFWNGIERCAYLVDRAWMTKAIGLIDAVTPMHLRAFCTDQRKEARDWLSKDT